jgi:hypothetical protein
MVLSEVAAVGQGGLQVNEAGTSRRLPVPVGEHPAVLLLLGGVHEHRALLALGLLDKFFARLFRSNEAEIHARYA